MMKKVFVIFMMVFLQVNLVLAAEPPGITAAAAILIDEETGTVLFERYQHRRMFPASMTKTLTAIIALQYLDINEIIVTGSEVHTAPPGSSLAGHRQGESIKVENLIRGLFISSGNETANIVAREVARRHTGDDQISFVNAEQVFTNLMNEKARELGALDSNFTNAHGFHDPNHFTSPNDMALIARAAMQNDIIRRIVSEPTFSGNGAGPNATEDMITQEYNWQTRNQLMLAGAHFFSDATGMKTGFTNEAGHCVIVTAERDGMNLIVIVFNSPEPGRWEDARNLLDFGFDNFSFEIIQEEFVSLEYAYLNRHRLVDRDYIELITIEEFGGVFSQEQIEAIQVEIIYLDRFMHVERIETEAGYEERRALRAPIIEGEIVANVVYTLNGEVIFESLLIASRDVYERTFISDVTYYFDVFTAVAFSLIAIPFWVAGFTLLLLIVRMVVRIKRRNARRYRRTRGNKRRYR